MGSEHEGSRRKFDNREWDDGEGARAAGDIIRLVLPDQSLAALGFLRGDTVDVLLGDIWQGDLAALLLASGGWVVGFAFFAYAGVRLHSARTDMPPKYLPLDAIITGGRIVRTQCRAILQAAITLPCEGVDRIRFRFRI